MEVTVQVAKDVALALHQKAPASDDSRKLLQALDDLNVMMKPMHPGTDESVLDEWFTIGVSDLVAAEQVIATLQRRKEVKAAYIKPLDEVP